MPSSSKVKILDNEGLGKARFSEAVPEAVSGDGREGRLRPITKLWLALVLPRFALEVLQRGTAAPAPAAIMTGSPGKAVILVCNRAADQAGIRPGQKVPAALSLWSELKLLARDTEAEARSLTGLCAWAEQFTPIVNPVPPIADAPAGLRLEIGASLTLFGGASPLATQIQESLSGLGYSHSVATAPNPSAAWLLALTASNTRITDRRQLAAALSPLPLAVLGMTEKALTRLHGIGVRNLGQCRQLPRGGLARRLGPELLDQLDRAFGDRPDPVELHTPADEFKRQLFLPGEVGEREALLFAVRRLLQELGGQLSARAKAVQGLVLRLTHVVGPDTRVDLALSHPSLDMRECLALLAVRLESIVLDRPVVEIGVEIDHTARADLPQMDLFESKLAPDEQWRQVVQRLQVKLGAKSVTALHVEPDYRPERAWGYGHGEDIEACAQKRPLWLLEAPQRLSSKAGRPLLKGALSIVSGPERIESGWWDGNDVRRDYFIVENGTGQRFWVYHGPSHPRRWYLHGIFA